MILSNQDALSEENNLKTSAHDTQTANIARYH